MATNHIVNQLNSIFHWPASHDQATASPVTYHDTYREFPVILGPL